jgi:hypothetical protein
VSDSNFKQRISKDEFQNASWIRFAFPRRETPGVVHRTCPSEDRGRREDRVPTAPMVRVQQKKHAAEPQVGGSSGLPCAMVYGLYVISPVTMLGCHRHLAGCLPRNLAPASERQDHTISPSAAMPLVASTSPASIASHPAFVTIAKRPSCRGGTQSDNHNFGKNEIEKFLAVGLDDTYQIDPPRELRFLAQAICGLLRRHARRDMTEIELICPTSGAISKRRTFVICRPHDRDHDHPPDRPLFRSPSCAPASARRVG